MAIRSDRVSDNCPKFCPCCGKGEQSFIQFIGYLNALPFFSLCQYKSLDFIDDFFHFYLPMK